MCLNLYVLKDSKPKLFVTCNRENDCVFNDIVNGTIVDEKVIMQQTSLVGCLLDVENVKDNDVATILYTSGTTGILFLSHQTILVLKRKLKF